MGNSSWLDRLLKLLKRALGFKVERPTVRILEEYHADGISVLRLEDTSIPGCCELWRIDRHREGLKFFICAINVQYLRQELAALGLSYKDFGASRGKQLAGNLQQQIQAQSEINATHYWITGWHKTVSSVDKRGRSYQSQRTADVRLLAGDFQGAAGPFAGDRYIKRFARKIVHQLAANEFREMAQPRTWQMAVKAINWAGWLSGLAQSKTGINPEHVLQPAKPKRSRIGSQHKLNE